MLMLGMFVLLPLPILLLLLVLRRFHA